MSRSLINALFGVAAAMDAEARRNKEARERQAEIDSLLKPSAEESFNWEQEHYKWRLLNEDTGLPTCQASILLKHGEAAYWEGAAVLLEARSVRRADHAGRSVGLGMGIRVGHGQTISRGHEEMTVISQGVLTVTNLRLFFNGDKQNRSLLVGNIVSLDTNGKSVEIGMENHAKNMVFSVRNGFILRDIIEAVVDAAR